MRFPLWPSVMPSSSLPPQQQVMACHHNAFPCFHSAMSRLHSSLIRNSLKNSLTPWIAVQAWRFSFPRVTDKIVAAERLTKTVTWIFSATLKLRSFVFQKGSFCSWQRPDRVCSVTAEGIAVFLNWLSQMWFVCWTGRTREWKSTRKEKTCGTGRGKEA